MGKNPPHKWHFQFTPAAFTAFQSMQPGHKRSLLHSLRQLVNADDPYTLPFVEMLQAERFHRLRKFRVGPYRVFFAVRREEIIHEKHPYRGVVVIVDIRSRREAY